MDLTFWISKQIFSIYCTLSFIKPSHTFMHVVLPLVTIRGLRLSWKEKTPATRSRRTPRPSSLHLCRLEDLRNVGFTPSNSNSGKASCLPTPTYLPSFLTAPQHIPWLHLSHEHLLVAHTFAMAPRITSPKKERLTLAQLTSYDDILTDALVDHVGFHSSRPVLEFRC
jgi:hypothetical protein